LTFGIGIIGATGFIGGSYRAEIRDCPQDAEIVALCGRRRDRLEAAARTDGARLVTGSWREVVEHPSVNLVLVLTPDALHLEPVLTCAAAGRHVLCEKPVGADAGQAWRMWNACKTAKIAHYVPLWARHSELFVQAREHIRGGLLGAVRAVIYRWHNPRPESMPFTWRDDASLSSAGTIADVGTHAYDAVRWLLDDEARRVFAQAAAITPPKPDLGGVDLQEALDWAAAHSIDRPVSTRRSTTPDYAALTVEFQRGAVGVFVLSHATYLRKGLAPELELHGDHGSLAISRVDRKLSLVRPGGSVEVLYAEDTEPKINRFTRFVFPGLRARIAGGGHEYPGLEDGWRAQLFTDAAAAAGRRERWVDLEEVEAGAIRGS
jgi:predicted dehydrogenase